MPRIIHALLQCIALRELIEPEERKGIGYDFLRFLFSSWLAFAFSDTVSSLYSMTVSHLAGTMQGPLERGRGKGPGIKKRSEKMEARM